MGQYYYVISTSMLSPCYFGFVISFYSALVNFGCVIKYLCLLNTLDLFEKPSKVNLTYINEHLLVKNEFEKK